MGGGEDVPLRVCFDNGISRVVRGFKIAAMFSQLHRRALNNTVYYPPISRHSTLRDYRDPMYIYH